MYIHTCMHTHIVYNTQMHTHTRTHTTHTHTHVHTHTHTHQMSHMLAKTAWAYAKRIQSGTQLFNAPHHKLYTYMYVYIRMYVHIYILTHAHMHRPPSHTHKLSITHITRHHTPQELANTAWAYAKTTQDATQLFDSLQQELLHNRDLETFIPQELSNLLWSYAKLGRYDMYVCIYTYIYMYTCI